MYKKTLFVSRKRVTNSENVVLFGTSKRGYPSSMLVFMFTAALFNYTYVHTHNIRRTLRHKKIGMNQRCQRWFAVVFFFCILVSMCRFCLLGTHQLNMSHVPCTLNILNILNSVMAKRQNIHMSTRTQRETT